MLPLPKCSPTAHGRHFLLETRPTRTPTQIGTPRLALRAAAQAASSETTAASSPAPVPATAPASVTAATATWRGTNQGGRKTSQCTRFASLKLPPGTTFSFRGAGMQPSSHGMSRNTKADALSRAGMQRASGYHMRPGAGVGPDLCRPHAGASPVPGYTVSRGAHRGRPASRLPSSKRFDTVRSTAQRIWRESR